MKKKFSKSRKGIRRGSRRSLVSLIKKISLRPSETKHTHTIQENQQLNHNVPVFTGGNLATTPAITDNNANLSNIACRVGDEVIARGLSYKFWFASKLDRPNVMYKIVFFRYQSSSIPSATAPYAVQGTTNYLVRDLDPERFRIIKVVQFNLQVGFSAFSTGTAGDTDGREPHKYISVWLPMRNKKIKYENDSSTPSFQDIGYTIVAYDSFGTLITDNIASYAVNRKFYFKDP